MKFITIALLLLLSSIANAQSRFEIASRGKLVTIVYDIFDETTVGIAANMLADDIELLVGLRPAVVHSLDSVRGNVILVGTATQGAMVREIMSSRVRGWEAPLTNKRERFSWHFVRGPHRNIPRMMVVAGSDKRGAAYGALEISRSLGVHPWNWWADVLPEKKDRLSLPEKSLLSKEPSVRLRGIFINDECWGLNAWAAATYEPDVNAVGPKTYARVFELLLRLRANFIWPAMHPCTRGFYTNPENPRLADAYGIVVGSSHAEPMLRNNVDEWKSSMGEFNFITNRERVLNYWDTRVAESKNFQSVYTLGMRGIHDSGMVGVGSTQEKVGVLEEIIRNQRAMIERHLERPASEVSQAFTAYKEVLDIYEAGLQLPEDITIVWPDDNYGYIQRFSTPQEQLRSGGSGVYYHLSYWGRPHDYLWLPSTNPALIRLEMMKAYTLQSRELWVANVGDIKPIEYETTLFLDMAWDFQPFLSQGSEWQHLKNWHTQIFGSNIGNRIHQVMQEYYRLNWERRPEFMGWSQTEPTRRTHFSEYNHFEAGDEAQLRMDAFRQLQNEVKSIRELIPAHLRNAFYQLVFYPVMGAANMNHKFLAMEKAYHYAGQGRQVANDLSLLSRQAYEEILDETDFYNNTLTTGKWSRMMTHNPRSLPVYEMPAMPQWTFTGTGWGISAEGKVEERRSADHIGAASLPRFNNHTKRTHFFDVFLRDIEDVVWKATPSAEWIQMSVISGELKNVFGQKQQRVEVSIDWTKVPVGQRNLIGNIMLTDLWGKTMRVQVSADQFTADELAAFPTFVEENGFVSIHAGSYTRKSAGVHYRWQLFPGLGYSGKAMWACHYEILPKSTHEKSESVTSESPELEYDFFLHRSGNVRIRVICVPVHPLNSTHALRVGVSLNGDEPKVVNYQTYGRSEEWKLNVLSNTAVVTTQHRATSSGRQTLKIQALDPGVMIDRIEIDRGGLINTYSLQKESRN